jgi:hypothetical protein
MLPLVALLVLSLFAPVSLGCVCAPPSFAPPSYSLTSSLLWFNASNAVSRQEALGILVSAGQDGTWAMTPEVFRKEQILRLQGGGFAVYKNGQCFPSSTFPWPFGGHSGKEFLRFAAESAAVWPPPVGKNGTKCACVTSDDTLCAVGPGPGLNFTGPGAGWGPTTAISEAFVFPSSTTFTRLLWFADGATSMPQMFCATTINRETGAILSGWGAKYESLQIKNNPVVTCP